MRRRSMSLCKTVVFLVCAAIFGLTVPTPVANAQSPLQAPAGSQQISVAPAIIQDTVNPGITYTTQVTIGNGTTDPTAFHSIVEPLRPNDSVSQEMLERLGNSDWFKVSPSDFLLLGQQSRTVDVTITVPKDASPGGHYATVFFEAFVPGHTNAGASTDVTGRVGVVVLLTITGDVKQSVSATQKLHADAGFSTNYETPLTFALRNTGNVHLEPMGVVRVEDIFGRKVKEIPLTGGFQPGAGPLLLPGAEHTYQSSWEHGLRFGLYKAEATITVGDSKTPVDVGTTRFFVCSTLFFILGLLAIVVVLVLLTIAIRRKRRRARKARAKETVRAKLAGSAPETPEQDPPEQGAPEKPE